MKNISLLGLTMLVVLLSPESFSQTNTFPASGNVGIGTTSPAEKLVVAGNIDLPSYNYWSYIKNSATYGGLILGTGNSNGTFTDGIKITSGGNYIALLHPVGIGTTTPSASLEVRKDHTYGEEFTNLLILNNAPTGNSGDRGVIAFKHTDTGNGVSWFPAKIVADKYYDGTNFSGSLLFQTKSSDISQSNLPTTKMVILESGNVGIATTSPAVKLDVNGTGRFWVGGNQINNITGTIVIGGGGDVDLSYSTAIKTINTASTPDYWRPRMGLFTQNVNTYLGSDLVERVSILPDNGNVGIGITTPSEKLYVTGNIMASGTLISTIGLTLGSSGQRAEWSNFTYGSYVDVQNSQNAIRFRYGSPATVMAEINSGGLIVTGTGTSSFAGSVGIGTTNPQNALDVNGTIRAKEIKATLDGWSDYVFDKGYKLMSLSDVERYIKANNKLPDIPSAGEVAKEGVNLGEMNAKLLQKVEELTLYVIELKKEINELKKK